MTLASRVFPEWVEPMAATLTQERFTGPEWIFERKLDGIRLLAFKNGQTSVSSRATGCRRTFPPSPTHGEPAGATTSSSTAKSRGVAAGRLPRVRHHVARRPRRDVAPARRAPGAAGALAAAAALRRVDLAGRSEAVGARVQRRLGRRHRQASNFASTSIVARLTG